jgi:hypothetical protein
MRNILLLGFALLLLGFAAAPVSWAAGAYVTSSSCCRPQCSVDRDCDRICGVGLGQCRQVNSCCKQCICAATS